MKALTAVEADILRSCAPGAPDFGKILPCAAREREQHLQLVERGLLARRTSIFREAATLWHLEEYDITPLGRLALRIHDAARVELVA